MTHGSLKKPKQSFLSLLIVAINPESLLITVHCQSFLQRAFCRTVISAVRKCVRSTTVNDERHTKIITAMMCRGKTCAKDWWFQESMNERANEEKFFTPYVRSENLNERESIVWNLNVNSRSIPMVCGFIVLFGSVRDALYFPDEMQIFLQASKNVLAEGRGCRRGKERGTLSVSIVDIGRFGFLARCKLDWLCV